MYDDPCQSRTLCLLVQRGASMRARRMQVGWGESRRSMQERASPLPSPRPSRRRHHACQSSPSSRREPHDKTLRCQPHSEVHPYDIKNSNLNDTTPDEFRAITPMLTAHQKAHEKRKAGWG